jgi:hypothetical protein
MQLIGTPLPRKRSRKKGDTMAKIKMSTDNKQGQNIIKTYETLEKRVLNSNLSDEDKITLIQLIGNHQNTINIPSVWNPYSQPLAPAYRETRTDSPKMWDYIVTCSAGNDACPNAKVSCLNNEE